MQDISLNSRNLILNRDNRDRYQWSTWIGADPASAVELRNIDGSRPRLRQINVSNEMIAYDAALKITSEIYKLTLAVDEPPSANGTYWISDDDGLTKTRVKYSHRRSHNQKAFWSIVFKLD
jgi:hypothetical protein